MCIVIHMDDPLISWVHVRITEDLRSWLEAHYPSRGEVSQLIRELLEAKREESGARPLPEILAMSFRGIRERHEVGVR